MEILYAPWRTQYSTAKPAPNTDLLNSCVFCAHFVLKDDDEQNFILKRFEHSVVMLNLHPYNAGHLLILPYEHKSSLEQLSLPIRTELMEALNTSIGILNEVLRCSGINMGLNLGKASGGSIPEHIHFHVIPRWLGDTNFLAVAAHTKQVSINLREIYDMLKVSFAKI
ncbi:HIT domain-containing protein [Candidatus Dependentiae bacterium]|nr:HIT domain-containing protein [Candidatus Dependentiae bacterium]